MRIKCKREGKSRHGHRASNQAVCASQDYFRHIARELPELVIENCSSGGHRLEPSMMSLVSQASFSDAHEALSIPLNAANLHRLTKLNGFHHAGVWINEVNGNWDKLYDVQVGDLIWGIDDKEYINEPSLAVYFQDYFYNSSREDPTSIVIHLERDGVDHDITVNRRDYYDESNGKATYYEKNQ